MKVFTTIEKARIIELYKNKTPIRVIREEFKCEENRIRDVILESGMEIKKGNLLRKIENSSEKEIVKLYSQGLTAAQIGEKFNVKYNAIIKILKKYNIEIKQFAYYGTISFNEEQTKAIIKDYLSGKNGVEVGEKFNVSESVIYKLLRKNNIKVRKSIIHERKHILRENYFEKIDTANKAYFLGLIAADGCAFTDKYAISIALEEDDAKIVLNKLISEIFITEKKLKLTNKKNRNSSWKNILRLDIYSKILYLDINKLGIIPRKSQILEFPSNQQVSEEFIWDYIRGYFDGDGSVYKRGKWCCVDFAVSEKFAEKLQLKLLEFKINSNIYKKVGIFCLRIVRLEDLYKFYKLIYDNIENKQYLPRKYIKFNLPGLRDEVSHSAISTNF